MKIISMADIRSPKLNLLKAFATLMDGLPEKLFYGAGIPAAELVFRKNKADDKVLFIDASRDFEAGKNQNLLRESDLMAFRKEREQLKAKLAILATQMAVCLKELGYE